MQADKTGIVGPKRVAVFVPGGIGESGEGQPIAVLEGLIRRLAGEFVVTVYSLSHARSTPETGLLYQLKVVNARHNDPLIPRMLRLATMFRRDHRKKRYHLLHAFWAFPPGILAVLLGKVFRIPVIVSLQGGEAAHVPRIAYGNMLHPRLKKATLWTCRKADILTALTEFQWRSLQKFGLQRDTVQIIPYGADRGLFKPNQKIYKPPYHFLHVANLNPVKNQETLLQVFATFVEKVDARLRVVGPDYLNGRLPQFAAELGITGNVEFSGYVPHEQLPEHYRWAHFLLHTSYYEGQGIVIAEAAASGVVVCGTRVGLIADLGEDGTVSADVGDAGGLAEKMLNLLQQPVRIEVKRRNALTWATAHDVEWTARQYVKLYKQLMNKKHEE
jgi:glycosyltransferase involved in cell wall biosynthesis